MTGTTIETEEFKMTEIGALPFEWEVAKLGNLVKSTKGKKPHNMAKVTPSNSLPYLTAVYFRTGQATHFVSLDVNVSLVLVENNDVVFIWDGSNAGDVFTGLKGVLASTMVKIAPEDNNTLDKKYLFYFLKNRFDLFNSTTTGSTIPHVNKKVFQDLSVPVPPLPEQKKIAYVLSSVRAATEKVEGVIKAARDLKKSLMKHLFTYGPVSIDEAKNVPLKETEIGLVPEGWELVRLGEVATFSSKPRDLNLSTHDKVPFVPMEYIPDERTDINRYQMKKPGEIGSGTFFFKGDLLVAKITPSFENGKQCIANNLPSDFAYATTEVWPLHETNRADLLYLFYYLKGKEVRANIAGKMEGSTGRQRVPRRVLQSLYIPLPPLPIQKQITHILSLVDGKIEPEENKKQALEALFKTLLTRFMTGKIRVNSLEVSV